MDYARITSAFWTGKVGRLIRGDKDAQIVALYLMTSPHANAIGVYHCPIIYIAHETGSTLKRATKGLQRLVEIGFCSYDEECEMVWVHEMARHQFGDYLKASDNRSKLIHKLYAEIPESHIKQGFMARYRDMLGLPDTPSSTADNKPSGTPSGPLLKPSGTPSEALRDPFGTPSEALRSPSDDPSEPVVVEVEVAVSDTVAVEESVAPPSAPPPPERGRTSDAKRGTRLPDNWQLPDAWAEWALGEQPTWTPAHLRKVADSFRDFWASKPGAGARKTDWLATWRNWVRREGPLKDRRAETKFDPTAYINRGRISTQRGYHDAEPIDITGDILDRSASGAGRDCADRPPVQSAGWPLSAPMAVGICRP